MAFIIVADHRSQELERRELAGPIVIGRSPECDLPIRDILLSRRHCMLERIGDSWIIADLNSKNGTRVNGEPITRHILRDNDIIRIGRVRIAFRQGPFVPAPPDAPRARQRPADPLEALAGTMAGFRFNEAEEEQLDQQVLETFPRPQPRPNEPRAYQSEQVYNMLSDIASSAWDNVLTEPKLRRPSVRLPRPMVVTASSAIQAPVEVIPAANPLSHEGKTSWRSSVQRIIALLYILLIAIVTGVGVWVISWGW